MGELKHIRAGFLAALLGAAALLGCSRGGGAAGGGTSNGLPSADLDQAIGDQIGDPTTCVLIVDVASGKTLYQYGSGFNCARPWPACDRAGSLTARSAVPLAQTPDGRGASCPVGGGPGAMVGWAEGKIAGAKRPLVYSAVMDGSRALPGHEMAGRLEQVFANLGIGTGD
ncbi:MAG: hypothetical protein ACRED8_02455 [Caulobacteraceae bacterium]